MRVFVSYSVPNSDEYILTLLSKILREKSYSVNTSQSFYNKILDVNTMKEITESNLFVGIILESGNEKDRVIEEWNYSASMNIPNLLLIENSSSADDFISGNYIRFNRLNTQSAINEISRKMIPKQAGTDNSDDLIPWALGGEVLISILTLGFPSSEPGQSKYIVSGRLKLIEQQLISIDSAAFQNLCDIYLAFREQELVSINRIGSQFGKQKTIKGTPDMFFRLSDGSLRYVEYTTKAESIVEKIKEDIDKCLDQTKTGIPATDVHKVIICFNSRLDVSEETDITKHAELRGVRIELIGLDWLALEIYSKYLILAKDILGIPLDTGQILPIHNFIDEYNNKAGKLSTPLDNIFLNRKTELNEISKILPSVDLFIISGFPGVGKTKFALEAINNFLSINNDYSGFAISKKDQDISEDLKIHLQQEKNYILLVDDANRQVLNFKQILGVFKEKRRGHIKLVITVRDYALNDVINECFEFDPHKIVLKKFTDEEIIELISSDSFEIKNPKYHKRIVEVADGNARLAVMAARLAKQRQEYFLLGDVSDLYDSYFQTFIKDFNIFEEKGLIKTLGIISFFYTIDRNNKEFIESILVSFGMDYYNFNEAIDELEKRELVEVQYNHARVSEQVMATYFFYKVFIKDEILPFRTLLFTFFPKWKKRFSDTIIPSNNSFGYKNVLNKLNYSLDEYLNSIYGDEPKVLEFFDLFWFYKREETLDYFHRKTKKLPEPKDPIYNVKYETNDFVWDRDKTLDFLSGYFNQYSESYIPSLELAFEYCRKKPESLPEFIRRIQEKLLFDEDDHRFDFQRQVELFNLLISKFRLNQSPYVEAFFALAGTFLAHHFQITKGGRKHTITFYQYPLPYYEVTREFRKQIWSTLFEYFDIYPKEVFAIISHFRPGIKETIPEIINFDLSLLLPFIEKNLNCSLFEHIHFVHEFISWLDREELDDRSYQKLKFKFNSVEYEYFKKLDWNRFRGKQDYEFEKYEDFEKLKEHDIRNFFIFKTQDDFKLLHKSITKALSVDENNGWGINRSLDIILEENFIQNNEIGFQLLESIFNNFPICLNPLYKSQKTIISKSEDMANRLWGLINSWNHNQKMNWQFVFFDYLPQEFVTEFYRDELLRIINLIDQNCTLNFDTFGKFQRIDSDIIIKILRIAVDKIDKENLKIGFWYHFFENYSALLSNDIELFTKAYIQQEMINNHFDFHREGFKKIVLIYPQFLFDYIKSFYTEKEFTRRPDTNTQLPFIWDLEDYENLVENATNLIIENTVFYGILEHPLIILFHNLNEEQKRKADKFIHSYITKYNGDPLKMNSIFDVLRHVLTDLFEEALIHYLSINSNVDSFKEIWWIGKGGSYVGDVIIGDIHAKAWQNILEIVNKINNQLELIPIKTYIKKQIENELRSGEGERKWRFINPDDW
ncbi:ATP-binding protein [Candidatus Dojkabacteria bacterium]|nr:ATP-binding protein [Candidatus Dojkabacteria bacterium]